MLKPKGGAGNPAPYRTVMVRTPVPIKAAVEAVITRYRNAVLSGEKTPVNTEDVMSAISLVNQFVEEVGIKESSLKAPTRDNSNLLRFLRWLESKK